MSNETDIAGAARRVRFGEFALDRVNRALFRRGAPVQVEPKVFDCIALLVSRPAELTTTERIHAELWPDVKVGPGALRRIINAARKALGDRGDEQALIKTRKGIGYVFLGSVEPEAALPAFERRGATTWPFVGREAELHAIRNVLLGAEQGRGALCLVAGEAGAGKSTLIAELRRRSGIERWLVGYCEPDASAPAFWPWRRITTQLSSHGDLAELLAAIAAREPELVRMIPELSERHGAPGAEAPDAEQRFLASDAFSRMLESVAEAAPLAVVIEDAHWADEGSVQLLGHVARAALQKRIAVIVTYRPAEVAPGCVLSQMIARAAGREGMTFVPIQPLRPEDLYALLRALNHPTATPAAAEMLEQLTGGNPLFVREALNSATARASGAQDGAASTFTHFVADRLRHLPEETVRLLGLASVLGRDFSLSLLASVAGEGLERVRDGFDPALSSGLLAWGSDTSDELRFVHALLRDALYAGLPAQTKRSHHGAALMAWRGRAAGFDRNAALASHAFLAGSAVAVEETAAYCERAGREAFASLAFDRAAVHLGRAVSLLREAPVSEAKAALLLAWARARWHSDEPMEAVRAAYLEAAQVARAAAALRLHAEAAIGCAVGEDSLQGLRSAWWSPEIVEQLETCLTALEGDANDPLGVDLKHRVARTVCWMRASSADVVGAAAAAQFALRHAPLGKDAWTETLLVGLQCGEALWSAEPDRARPFLDALCAQPGRTDLSARKGVDAAIQAMAGCLVLGEGARYADVVATLGRRVDELPAPLRFGRLGERLSTYRLLPPLARATIATIRGAFAEAAECFAFVRERAEALGVERTRVGEDNTILMLLLLLGYQGHAAAVQPLLDRYAEAYPEDAWHVTVARAQIALERADMTEARRHYQVLRATGFRTVFGGRSSLPKSETRVRIADLCARLGDAADAELLYGMLIRGKNLCVAEAALISMGSFGRPLGELALLRGDVSGARDHFERALEINERFGHRPEVVRTRHGLSRALRLLGYEEQAQRQTAAALTDARAMGMLSALPP